jgi:hypothetical protein
VIALLAAINLPFALMRPAVIRTVANASLSVVVCCPLVCRFSRVLQKLKVPGAGAPAGKKQRKGVSFDASSPSSDEASPMKLVIDHRCGAENERAPGRKGEGRDVSLANRENAQEADHEQACGACCFAVVLSDMCGMRCLRLSTSNSQLIVGSSTQAGAKPMTLSRHHAAQATGSPAAGGVPSVEDVLAELDQMYQTLLAKDEDLKLAGQIGTTLLERVEESKAQINMMTQTIEGHERELEQLQ